MWNWWRKRTQIAATKDHDRKYTCWEKDYQLQDPGRLALFDEYLEMSEYNEILNCHKNIILFSQITREIY